MNSFTFRPHWLLAALALLAVEVAIARYAPQGVLRGFGGDVLVVVLVYALLRTCVAQPAARLALWALLFACAIEGLQGLGMVDVLGLHDQTALHRILRIALGTTFDVWDLVAYGCGWLVCRALDLLRLAFRWPVFQRLE
ncbi:DUF2809 domain-containing protein [Rhodoferax saidenbachensis]|uniref:DUF2809 domain-containing protein n=1 Tax=Rhodoferax saidenbachensis TaxID=1484693 RepID=A0ABU1ZLK5_9BURK|nr:DUF2809 domain-containing protein [Rhodoferax saidenbachensis]MDR7306368.1 hypothetical protein [Rhodoferax saidenbachensis]